MPKQNLLVADADPRSLRILELALRKAGFAVATAGDGGEALRRIQRTAPDLVLAEAGLPTQDGFELCKTIRSDDRFRTLPVLLMSADRDPLLQAQAIDAGADDFIDKPILVKDLVGRVRGLLSQRLEAARVSAARGAPAALSGSVADLGLVDLFNSLETWHKSGVVHCEDGARTARVWVRDGQVIDAEVEALVGDAAFYRLLGWETGSFRVEFGAFIRAPRTEAGTQALLLEGMRRIDEAGRLVEVLPPSMILEVDFAALAQRLGDLPDEVNGVLRLLDGHRTLRDVVANSALDDLSTLAVAQRLMAEGVARRVEVPASAEPPRKPSLEQWLGGDPLVWAHNKTPPVVAPAPAAPVDSASTASVVASPAAVSAAAPGGLLPAEAAEPLPPDGEGTSAEPAAEPLEAEIADEPSPELDLHVVRYAPVRGARRERVRRENEIAKAAIAAGRPVRLVQLVEMPPAPDGSDAVPEAARRASDAAGEAARRFAPDPLVARVIPWAEQQWRTWTPAEKDVLAQVSPDPSGTLSVTADGIARSGRRTAAAPLQDRHAPRRSAVVLWAAALGAVGVVAISLVFALRPGQGPIAPTRGAAAPQTTAPAVAVAPAPGPEKNAAPAPAVSPPASPPATTLAAAPTPAQEYGRALREGESLLKHGHYRAAVEELRKALQIDPRSVPALLSLGDALIESDQPRSALEPLQQAAELDPRSARAHLLLGTAYQGVGRKGDAMKAYRRYLAIAPHGEFATDVRAIVTNLGRGR